MIDFSSGFGTSTSVIYNKQHGQYSYTTNNMVNIHIQQTTWSIFKYNNNMVNIHIQQTTWSIFIYNKQHGQSSYTTNNMVNLHIQLTTWSIFVATNI